MRIINLSILFMIMLCSVVLAICPAGMNGDGASNPCVITNCLQLQAMNQGLNLNYELGNDVDCAETKNWNGGAGFSPIGNDTDINNIFTGSLYGKNNTISNLYLSKIKSINLIGLFGVVDTSTTISNLGLINITVRGGDRVGALVYSNSGTVNNCYAIGNVSGNGSSPFIGGLVSQNFGSIKNSYFSGNISGNGTDLHVGGLVSQNFGSIFNSYFIGNISGNVSQGALGSSSFGCLVSDNYAGGYINNSFASCNISIQADTSIVLRTGGLIGYQNNGVTTNSYMHNMSDLFGCSFGGITGCTAIADINYFKGDVSSDAPFSLWSFGCNGIWNEVANDYPHLAWEGVGGNIGVPMDGDGTANNPYQITNCCELQLMNMDLDAHYVLMNDVDCSETKNWNGGKGFEPVGDNVNPFAGELDGDEKIINDLNINRADEDYVGLFGLANMGIIKNIGLKEVNITGQNYVGALLGEGGANISFVVVSGNLSVVNDYAGGLVGFYYPWGIIYDSYSYVNISNSNIVANLNDFVGSFVGDNDGKINHSFSYGNLIQGWNSFFNLATGGFVGANDGIIQNSFYAGTISIGLNSQGFAGENVYGSLINCYWYKPSGSSLNCYSGGNTGCTSVTDINYFKSDVNNDAPFSSWDFFGTWEERENDYPSLTWQGLGGSVVDCISHNYFQCYDNDVYYYDSCNVLEDKKTECGTSGYVGNNYCYDNDLYRDYITAGCNSNNCTNSTQRIKQSECVNGCNNNACMNAKADFAWFRPVQGVFDVLIYDDITKKYSEKFISLGTTSDIPIPADFDGDGITDAAVLQSNGKIRVKRSSDKNIMLSTYGTSGLKSAAADYDGDKKADFAWYKPSTGEWIIYKSSTNYAAPSSNPRWGDAADIPKPADYDGDGKADIAVHRADGYIIASSSMNGQAMYIAKKIPNSAGIAVPADFDGDKKADFAWYIRSTARWKIFTSSNNYQEILPNPAFGDANSVPIPADYDGDGKADLAVFNYMKNGKIAFKSLTGNARTSPTGNPNWRPAVGNYG